MRQMTGKQSISFAKAVYIEGSAAIVGEKEKDGPLGEYFSHTLSDPMCGQESWEEGESELQLATAKLAMQKANVRPEQIRMIFAGDLLAQSIASSFGLVDLNCPLYGLFGACSTMGEALSLGAMAVAGGYGDRVLTVTSSHFGTAEKEFRFPLAYGNQRPPSASWTVTGSGCGCAASVLAEYLLPKLENGEWKRILFVPTGALMSKVSFQEGSSVPGIAQAVVIEREEDV
jgi:stage V sporulation protein AD